MSVYVTNLLDIGYIRVTDVTLNESEWNEKFFEALDASVADIIADEADYYQFTDAQLLDSDSTIVDMTFGDLVKQVNSDFA